MGSTCRRNPWEFTFALPPLHRPFYHCYSLFILCCCLASLVATSVAELLEASTATTRGCSQAERDALLTFKLSVQDPSNRLESWNSQHDCCGWIGVVCHNDTTTAHVYVVELNLANPNPHDNWENTVLRGEKLSSSLHNWENTVLRGKKLSSSLHTLAHLESLNLSWDDFGGTKIPEFIGSFQKLRYLNLQRSNFSGTVPPQLGNLSSLRYLDLSYNFRIRAQSLDWLTHLSTLVYLDLSSVNLSVISNSWLSTVNMLPSLKELRLSECSLDQIPSSLSHLNLTSLVTLDLSRNYFNSTLPSWLWQLTALTYLDLHYGFGFHGTIPTGIGNLHSLTKLILFCSSLSGPLPNVFWSLTHLTELDLTFNLLRGSIPIEIGNLTNLSELVLSECSLGGPIPDGIGYLTSLKTLDLSGNYLSGPIPVEIGYLISLKTLDLSENSHSGLIPTEIGNLTSLTKLDLSTNSLTGLVPVEVGKLFNLITLDLHSNSFEGVVSWLHFTNLTNLWNLDLSHNSLLTINHNWVIPFQLQSLTLDSLMLGPRFPMWLRSHNSIEELTLSNTSIKGNLPDWFWTSFPTIRAIDLSYNEITGTLPLSLESFTNLTFLNLRSNFLEGPVPKFHVNMFAIDLSNNSFSGPLLLDFSLPYYDVSYNQIHGRIPLSICNSTQPIVIDLSHNHIFGEIPHCEWLGPSELEFIHLGNNNLSGKIPSSIGLLNNIESLHLNNNNFSGEIPSSLQNCSELHLLDIGNNKLSGTIPTWIGQSLQSLVVLRLRSNMFSGDIPLHIGQLSNLQIIDLASNFLTGSIPSSFGNLSAIMSGVETRTFQIAFTAGMTMTTSVEDIDNINIVTKGYEYSFSKTLFHVKSIDLSTNHLDGEIPKELGSLIELQTLNLSRNYLKGNIPSTIGRMKSLETLDLSYNMLSGAIPQDLSALNYLNHLNLSYNNLSGMIPQGYQLQTLQDASIYKGNANLCGALIHKSCSGNKNATIIVEEQEDSSQMLPEYLSITLGFLLSLWSVFVILLFKKGWRNSYFSIVDQIFNKAYVSIKLRLNRQMVSQ